MEKFHKFDLKEEKYKYKEYIDEGWIETKLVFAAKDEKAAGEFFAIAVESLETKKIKPTQISFHEIQQNPFVGALTIEALFYDIEALIEVVLNFAPLTVEIKKENFEIPLSTLNQIFLDISDIVKTFEHLSKLEIYSKDTHIKSPEIYANIILEFHNENKESLKKSVDETMNAVKTIASVISQNRDEILEYLRDLEDLGNLEEETEMKNKKIYTTNVEMKIKTDLFSFVDLITWFKPVFIEVNAPHRMTMSRNEIYTLLGKLLLIAQKHTERITASPEWITASKKGCG